MMVNEEPATLLALDWSGAFAAGAGVCGGKGYNLGRLHRYGFRIPRGGVLPAAWYAALMQRAPAAAIALLRDARAESATDPAVVDALAQVRLFLETAEQPHPQSNALASFLDDHQLGGAAVAVRSSATAEDGARASFAGIHRSYLNVRGREAISRAVRQCYASLWTPHALAYRRRMGYRDDEVLCAVVICEMVHASGREEPIAAGVAFSFDPLNGRRDVLVIDAAPGLGEAVVGGTTEPQRIVYRNRKGILSLQSRSGVSALLPEEHERELASQVLRMHWAFGDGQDPQDVEWAFDGKALWFLQVRPATNVRRYLPAPVSALPRYWSTANIKDAVPGVVCTMSWSFMKDAVATVAFAAAIAGGYPIDGGGELVRRFRGRAYFELTLMQWVMYDSLGLLPAQLVQSIGGHQPEIPAPGEPYRGSQGRRRRWATLRTLRRIWGIERELERKIAQREVVLRDLSATALDTLSPAGLLDFWHRLRLDHDAFDLTIGIANSAEGPWELALEDGLKRVLGEQARPVLGRLLAGTGSVTSAEHGYALFQLAAAARTDEAARAWLASDAPPAGWQDLPADSPFRAALARFLEDFGHRAVYEADFINPRWVEDPAYILDQVRFLLANPQAGDRRAEAERLRREAELTVRRAAGWRAGLLLWLAGRVRRGMAARERAKSMLARLALASKRVALEIGRRLAAAGHLDDPSQVFHLSSSDFLNWLQGWWDGTGARELATDRALQRDAWLAQEAPPDVITEEPDGRVSSTPIEVTEGAEGWSGIGAAPGTARGAARIIHHPNQGHRLQAGEVLVAPSTDPGWTPLFLRASAIVMESGGYLSHGAIVAREYGIPAVVNLPGILSALRDGDPIVVDGDAGRVMRQPR